MARSSFPLWVVVCFVVLGAGCENTFTPKGPYVDRMIVYGVLSNRADTQYVRVYTTYDPPRFDPLSVTKDNMVRGADVVVTREGAPFRFREMLIPRLDRSRYNDDLLVYASHPFQLDPSKTYHLNVLSQQYGTVTSSVTVPKRGRIQPLNAYVLNLGGSEDENIVIYGWITELTYGILIRLYLLYEVLEGNKWVQHQEEIPNWVTMKPDSTKVFFFPVLHRRVTTGLVRDKEENETTVFSRLTYFASVSAIYNRYPEGGVHVKRALIVLTQVERNLYTYSMVVSGFQDPYSIRTDQPDYTNIVGGHGLFGAMVEDSLYVDLTLR